jgi:Cellulose-binding Sde182, nucleoside hydrolase-like domain/Cellulose-binding protein Sde0182, C-terminal domain
MTTLTRPEIVAASLPRKNVWASTALALGLAVALHPLAHAADSGEPDQRHRMVVLTDIEADPDDTQTLVRLLLYSNVIDIRGLIATTSVHRKTAVSPDSIRRVIEAYRAVRENLTLHEPGYPGADALLGLVKRGLPVYGMEGVGPGRNSEGSNWILQVLEQPDDRPLWISVWGGANTLAQALHELRTTRSEPEVRRLVAKLRVYTISDQDDSGIWMRKEFPELFYIVSPGGYGAGTWTGINHVVPGFDNTTISNPWLAENIQQGHGPLGARYPDVAYGMEGDTPSWLGLVPNGLTVPERPDWGGWGGRYALYRPELEAMDPKGFTGGVPVEPEPRPIWTNASDVYVPPVTGDYGRAMRPGEKSFEGFRVTLWRWRDDFQNDFAARMDWTTRPYSKANHPPVPVLGHAAALTVKSGEHFQLDAHDSTDPDGDSLAFWWIQYPEAASYKGAPLRYAGAENMARITLIAPEVQKEETTHVILKVTDRGSPPLSRYKRVIVTIQPK